MFSFIQLSAVHIVVFVGSCVGVLLVNYFV